LHGPYRHRRQAVYRRRRRRGHRCRQERIRIEAQRCCRRLVELTGHLQLIGLLEPLQRRLAVTTPYAIDPPAIGPGLAQLVLNALYRWRRQRLHISQWRRHLLRRNRQAQQRRNTAGENRSVTHGGAPSPVGKRERRTSQTVFTWPARPQTIARSATRKHRD